MCLTCHLNESVDKVACYQGTVPHRNAETHASCLQDVCGGGYRKWLKGDTGSKHISSPSSCMINLRVPLWPESWEASSQAACLWRRSCCWFSCGCSAVGSPWAGAWTTTHICLRCKITALPLPPLEQLLRLTRRACLMHVRWEPTVEILCQPSLERN